ncbi:HAD-IIB family hydrolase [Candidatus Peregrinibacteria bacterium]|nr:HAD-IIB family hydrolase [Candidatus Peregrinibacteria bacterium]
MFDFDGTITERGSYSPPQEMVDVLVKLAEKMPIAFCTGRQLESFEDHGLNVLIQEIPKGKRESFLENLYLFAENGAIGYGFNTDIDEFEELYRVKWPSKFISRIKLMEEMNKRVKKYGSVYRKKHRIVVVIRTKLHYAAEKVDLIYELSDKIYKICVEFLTEIDPDFEKYLHVGNSGIGVVICPANGDKDYAIKRFAEILKQKRGVKTGKNLREILVVGDQPQEGGNDHYFLNGENGTPFSVGVNVQNKPFPMPVTDNNGKRIFNAKGTIHLLKSLIL